MSSNDNNGTDFGDVFTGGQTNATDQEGITTKAFVLNLATGFILFALQTTGFFLLKNSSAGRRL